MHTVQTVFGFYASPILLTHSSDTLKGGSSGPALSVEQMMLKKMLYILFTSLLTYIMLAMMYKAYRKIYLRVALVLS